MTSTVRQRKEQLEDLLRTEMAQAEDELARATPERLSDAVSRYQGTLYRFSRFVIDGELPPEGSTESPRDR